MVQRGYEENGGSRRKRSTRRKRGWKSNPSPYCRRCWLCKCVEGEVSEGFAEKVKKIKDKVKK